MAKGSPREDVDARLKKTEKEPVTREPLGPAKLTQRAGAGGFAEGRAEVGGGEAGIWTRKGVLVLSGSLDMGGGGLLAEWCPRIPDRT